MLGDLREAIDPYCVNLLSTSNSNIVIDKFNEYMASIGLGDTEWKFNLQESIRHLIEDANLSQIVEQEFDKTSFPKSSWKDGFSINADTVWKVNKKVLNSLTIDYSGYKDYLDLDGNPTPFSGMAVKELLTSNQIN